jgi:hypothetical protein
LFLEGALKDGQAVTNCARPVKQTGDQLAPTRDFPDAFTGANSVIGAEKFWNMKMRNQATSFPAFLAATGVHRASQVHSRFGRRRYLAIFDSVQG